MGILADEAVRLLRTKWTNPQSLAEEIYSILTSKVPVVIDSPLQVKADTPLPAVTITNNFGGSGVGLQTNGGTVTNGDLIVGGNGFTYNAGDTPVTPGTLTPFEFPVIGPPVPSPIIINQLFPSFSTPTTTPTPTSGSGGNCFVGDVVSGSGSSYSVALLGGFGTVSVIVVGLDSSEQLDSGYRLTGITLVDGTYYTSVPVWLD